LDVFRTATPAAATVSAVAATAPTAFVVHLVGSGSAMAHARFLAAVPPLALLAATLLVQSASALSMREFSSVVGPSSVRADPKAPVLLGSFVLLHCATVWWRARGSACQGLARSDQIVPRSPYKGVKRAGRRSPGPSPCPYSPKCVEYEFSEVQRRCVGIGGASSPLFLRFTRSLRHSTVTRSAALRKYISSPDRAGVSFEVSRPQLRRKEVDHE
jgi:hypothetical protein